MAGRQLRYCFDNPGISRLHSTLRKTAHGWELTDQSTNGTYLSNGEFLHNESRNINNNETIQLSKSGEKVCISFPLDGTSRRESGNDARQSNSVFTKVLPVVRPDFVKGLRSQPFFYVGLITAIAGILLFAFLQAALTDTGKGVETYVYLYEGTLAPISAV
jgi:pSer/pThr/pTyr-binding forkhead associated (FHA) protein